MRCVLCPLSSCIRPPFPYPYPFHAQDGGRSSASAARPPLAPSGPNGQRKGAQDALLPRTSAHSHNHTNAHAHAAGEVLLGRGSQQLHGSDKLNRSSTANGGGRGAAGTPAGVGNGKQHSGGLASSQARQLSGVVQKRGPGAGGGGKGGGSRAWREVLDPGGWRGVLLWPARAVYGVLRAMREGKDFRWVAGQG